MLAIELKRWVEVKKKKKLKVAKCKLAKAVNPKIKMQ